MPAASTAGDTASRGSWTKPCGDALQAAEVVEFALEPSMHDLSVFSDHSKKGIAKSEHAKKKKWIAYEHVYFSYISNHRLWATPFLCTAPAGVYLWNIH